MYPFLFTQDTKFRDEYIVSNSTANIDIYEPLSKYAVLTYVSTIHKSIGDTVKIDIYVIQDRNSSIWAEYGLYTACSRCQYSSQLKLVELTGQVEHATPIIIPC